MSNVPCHGLIHFMHASKLCLLGWICRLSLSPAFYGWCFDQTTSEFWTVFQNREETPHFLLWHHGVWLWKASSTAGLCNLSGLWEPEGRALSYCSALQHSQSQNNQSVYKLSNAVTCTASEQAQHPISMNVSPPETNLWSSQQDS